MKFKWILKIKKKFPKNVILKISWKLPFKYLDSIVFLKLLFALMYENYAEKIISIVKIVSIAEIKLY